MLYDKLSEISRNTGNGDLVIISGVDNIMTLDWENIIDIYHSMLYIKQNGIKHHEEFENTFKKIKFLRDNFVGTIDY